MMSSLFIKKNKKPFQMSHNVRQLSIHVMRCEPVIQASHITRFKEVLAKFTPYPLAKMAFKTHAVPVSQIRSARLTEFMN